MSKRKPPSSRRRKGARGTLASRNIVSNERPARRKPPRLRLETITPIPEVEAPGVRLAVAPAIIVTPDATARSRVGPLLRDAMRGLTAAGASASGMARMALDMSEIDGGEPVLPLAVTIPPIEPEPGERWPHYKERVRNTLGPVKEWLRQNAGMSTEELIAGNALRSNALLEQAREATNLEQIRLVELDPLSIVTTMDDAAGDVELSLFQVRHPELDGRGVRVAVLDSGVDTHHPWLQVADSVSTCEESVDIPGLHGTHVAGSLASRDTVYRGIAPGVMLLNIKVLTAAGEAQASFITRGVDEALDREAHVFSMSLGFNHLPTWSQRGHGWTCPDGRCQLCTAVSNAVRLENVIAVVAAGNEHERATFLRNNGFGDKFDSEIACPGAADLAITVGALTKQTFLTAPFSSRGPTAFGSGKPDVAGPGVNITSAMPVRRGLNGLPIENPTRGDLSRISSGTSMATPIVAGAVALILQRRREAGEEVSQAAVRADLLSRGFRHLGSPANEVGAGRLNLAGL